MLARISLLHSYRRQFSQDFKLHECDEPGFQKLNNFEGTLIATVFQIEKFVHYIEAERTT